MASDVDEDEQSKSDRHQSRCRSKKHIIGNVWQCFSVLLVPASLGILTAVMTLYQQEVAKQQRLEDQRASQQLCELEQTISDNRYLDDLLNNFILDIGELLKDNNGSLTSVDLGSCQNIKPFSTARYKKKRTCHSVSLRSTTTE